MLIKKDASADPELISVHEEAAVFNGVSPLASCMCTTGAQNVIVIDQTPSQNVIHFNNNRNEAIRNEGFEKGGSTGNTSPDGEHEMVIGGPCSPASDGATSSDTTGEASDGSTRSPGSKASPRANGFCRVCGERASGKFFGALVCLPCKSFFIRCTKEGDPMFLCLCDGHCDVSKRGRSRCQHCRYKRCLAAGMSRKEKPEAVEPEEGQLLCLVCGDIANGIHFGVYTCEGCKKFFRRGLSEHQSYECSSHESCTLNPRNRNNCRCCRYRKCVLVGMSRGAIKMGRPKKLCRYKTNCNSSIMETNSTERDDVRFHQHSEILCPGKSSGCGDLLVDEPKPLSPDSDKSVLEEVNVADTDEHTPEAPPSCRSLNNCILQSLLAAGLGKPAHIKGLVTSKDVPGITNESPNCLLPSSSDLNSTDAYERQGCGSVRDGHDVSTIGGVSEFTLNDHDMSPVHSPGSSERLRSSSSEIDQNESPCTKRRRRSFADSNDTLSVISPVMPSVCVPTGRQRIVPAESERVLPNGCPRFVANGCPRIMANECPSSLANGCPNSSPYTLPNDSKPIAPTETQRITPKCSPYNVPKGSLHPMPCNVPNGQCLGRDIPVDLTNGTTTSSNTASREITGVFTEAHGIMLDSYCMGERRSNTCLKGRAAVPRHSNPTCTERPQTSSPCAGGRNSVTAPDESIKFRCCRESASSDSNFVMNRTVLEDVDALFVCSLSLFKNIQQRVGNRLSQCRSGMSVQFQNLILHPDRPPLTSPTTSRCCRRKSNSIATVTSSQSTVLPEERHLVDKLETKYLFSPLSVCMYWNQIEPCSKRGQMSSDQHCVLQDLLEAYMVMLKNCNERNTSAKVTLVQPEDLLFDESDTVPEHLVGRLLKQIKEALCFMTKVPGFNNFHPKDTMYIVRNMCFSIITLMSSRDWYNPGTRTFENDTSWELPEGHPMYNFWKVAKDLGDRLHELHVDRTEVAMLCALNVAASDFMGVQEPKVIERARDFLISALIFHLSHKGVDPIPRMRELFQLVPALRLCGFWSKTIREKVTLDMSETCPTDR